MKKIYLVLLIAISLIGIVIANVSWNKDMKLDKTHTDTIKRATNVKTINPSVSDVVCDNKECWAWVYQEGVINTEIRIQGTGLSDEALQRTITNRTAQRLIKYADAIKQREAKGTPSKRIDEGVLNG